jgi:hypothetical protein
MQVVNGPEVLSKFVGETEKNVRDLFADAENDQKTRGELFTHLPFVIPMRHSSKVLWKMNVSLKVLCAHRA